MEASYNDSLILNDRLQDREDLETQDLRTDINPDKEVTPADVDRIYWKDKATRLDLATGQQVPFSIFSSLEKLEPALGFGAVTYLRFERALIVAFFFMSLLAITSTVFNGYGKVYANGEYMANYTLGPNATEPSYARYVSVQNHIASIPWSVTILDISNCFIFFIFVLWMRWNLHRFTPKLFNVSKKASHFTVEVSKLPPNVTENELIDFFEKFGTVHSVSIALNNGDLLRKVEEYNQLDHLKYEMKIDKKSSPKKKRGGWCCGLFGGYTLHTISLKLSQLEREIEELKQKEYQCCGIAFVTFENRSSALLCRNEYNKDFLLFQHSDIVRPFRDSIKLRVRGAPEPTDIIWKNLQYTVLSQTLRHLITAVITYSIIVVAIAIAYACAIPGIVLAKINKPALYAILFVCQVISVTTVIIVFILVPLFAEKFEMHHRWSRVELFVCLRLFFYQFVSSVALATVAFDLFRNNNYFVDTYTPFLGMLGEITLFTFFVGWFLPLLFRSIAIFKAKRKIKRGEYVDLRLLEKNLEGPVWSIADRFQNIIKPVFISLFYGAVVPMTIPVAFVMIFLNYWMDKHALLRRFKRPPAYDDKVPYVIITYILPFAVIFHLAVGAAVYYQKDYYSDPIFPKDSSQHTWIAMVSALGFMFVLCLASVVRNILSLCRFTISPYNRNKVKKVSRDDVDQSYSEIEKIDNYSPQHLLRIESTSQDQRQSMYYNTIQDVKSY